MLPLPAVMVPVSVPLKVPAPVVSVNAISVSIPTAADAPFTSRTSTATENTWFCEGSVPLFTDVIAICVATFGLMVNAVVFNVTKVAPVAFVQLAGLFTNDL